jgi:cytosine deaminase
LTLLRSATLPDARVVDVRLDGDTVAAIEPPGRLAVPTDPAEMIDLDGFVLLTAPAEPHAHLDKALSWDDIRPPMGDLELAISSWRAYAETMTVDDVADRARAAALALLRNGTTAVRSHVDILLGPEPLRGAEALVRVRAELSELIDIELVALTSHETPAEVIHAALDLGIELVGGAPHLAPDPLEFMHRLLAIAEIRDVGVDLHTDESLDGPLTLGAYARAVRNRAPGTSLSAGHCVRLGTLAPVDLDPIIADVVASDIGIISLPGTNLYLQGWKHPVSTPRGLTALRPLIDAGARLGAGADNVRDPFNPMGRSDALETASLLVTAGHLSCDEAGHLITGGARSVMRLATAGAVVGARAEFLAVRGGCLAEAFATAAPDRYVIHRGRLVSQSAVHHQTAVPCRKGDR